MTNEEIIRKAAGTINGNKDLLLEYSILLQATFGRVIDRINTIDTIIHYTVSTLWHDHEEDIRISDIYLIHQVCTEMCYGLPIANKCKVE